MYIPAGACTVHIPIWLWPAAAGAAILELVALMLLAGIAFPSWRKRYARSHALAPAWPVPVRIIFFVVVAGGTVALVTKVTGPVFVVLATPYMGVLPATIAWQTWYAAVVTAFSITVCALCALATVPEALRVSRQRGTRQYR